MAAAPRAQFRNGWPFGVFSLLLAALLLAFSPAFAQRKITCPDGEVRTEVDAKALAVQYEGASMSEALGRLHARSTRAGADAGTLEAAVAARQWNEILRGLANRYNQCAVSRERYEQALGIYPQLQRDAAKPDVEGYLANLRRFAEIAGKDIVLDHVTVVVEREGAGGLEPVLQALSELNRNSRGSPLVAPEELEKKGGRASEEYRQGFDLFQRSRFEEAVSHFERALLEARLPETYFALGSALFRLGLWDRAEAVFREGLPLARKEDPSLEASLTLGLAQALLDKGDLADAQAKASQALALQEQVYGPGDLRMSRSYTFLGQVLQKKRDLDGALQATLRALEIAEASLEPDHPEVATFASSLAAILYERGDLEGALDYQRRALKIFGESLGPDHFDAIQALANYGTMLSSKGAYKEALEATEEALRLDTRMFGADHIRVARRLRNIGMIRLRLGELDGALQETRRALYMAERLLGPNHVETASILSTLGWILKERGDLEGALQNAERALAIDESVYGPDHPSVALRSYQAAAILREKGDLDGALAAVQRALRISEKSGGTDFARDSHTLAQILLDQGDLEGAYAACQRALSIDETRSGPDHPSVARDNDTLAAVLLARGDADAALRFARRAREITEKASGPEVPFAALYAGRVGQVLQAKGDLKGARSHFESAHRTLLETYGPDNPATRKVEADLRAVEAASRQKLLPVAAFLVTGLAVPLVIVARKHLLARRAATSTQTAPDQLSGSSVARTTEVRTRLGPYRLEGRLGAGGMGVVYRAYDERLDRPVAVKIIPPEQSEDPNRRERLRREARASARLSHPSIIQVFDLVQTDEVDAIVMELVEGEPLAELLRRGPLDLARGLRIARQIAEALAEAHSKGIVHRDLKAENVIVTLSGHAKVLDFGIAKRLDGGDPSMTKEGAVLGTYRSMPPEQAHGHDVDHRADLFSLGTLLYEIFTGESPFLGPNGAATLRKICWHQQPPAREVNPRVPDDLSDLIDRLLQKEPHLRPQTTREVVHLLARMAAGTPAPESRPDHDLGGTTIGFFNAK